MNPRKLFFLLIAVLLSILFIGRVSARGGIFVIDAMGEITENVELMIGDEVSGNLSVKDGFTDVYVTSPSGIILFCYDKTRFSSFNFTAVENGTYVLSLVNAHQTERIEVRLYYTVHFKVVLQHNVGVSLGTAVVVPAPTSGFDWVGLVVNLGIAITTILSLAKLVKKILEFID